ncbi:MAG TPA: hypothetical protein VIJ10_08755 [Vicinamibacteria bacterium]|jgi:tetratricopeptide (TPR) repeat protein
MRAWPLLLLAGIEAEAAAADRAGLARDVLEALHQERFAEALVLASALQRDWPEDPVGFLMEANVRQTRMRDYRLRDDEPAFLEALARAESRGEALVRSRSGAEAHFLLGFVRGYRGLHLSRRGDWLGAFKAGRGSLSHMREALSLDPAFADALIPLAAFDYWKARKLPLLFRGSKDRAIEKLERAWADARLLQVEAAYALETVLLVEGEPVRAFEVNEWLHARYPRNPVGLYHRALLLERLDRRGNALRAWDELEARLRDSGHISRGFLAECALQRSRLLSAEGRDVEADLALQEALAHEQLRDPSAELDGPLHSADSIAQGICRALAATSTTRQARGKP